MYKERLKDLRIKHGTSQQELAEKLKLSKSIYSNYETEYAIIPLKHLNTLCNYFNVSIDYILGICSIKNYNNVVREELDINISSKRLKLFRLEIKQTQEKLATFLNTTHSVIAGFENGRNLISIRFLYAICKKYGISADYLLGRIDEPVYLDKEKKCEDLSSR